MEIMVSGRAMGKTSKLIRWMIQNDDAVLVVHDSREAERLHREYEHLGLSSDRFVTLDNREALRGMDVQVGVDNVDLILRSLLHPNTNVAAMTGHTLLGGDFGGEHEEHEESMSARERSFLIPKTDVSFPLDT